MKKYVLAIDLGTTGNRVIAFNKKGEIVSKSYYEFPQIFPKPGWVEHNPEDIWQTTRKAFLDVIDEVGVDNIDSIGITNQRETTVLWNKDTGKPIYNAIVWQCRRTKDICDSFSEYKEFIRERTGLFLDPYFSATKIKWIIDNVKGVKEDIKKGKIIFGTIDSWILWKLTNGKVHATESGNASRTLLVNIETGEYDKELLKLFDIPLSILPEIKDSGTIFGYTDKSLCGKEIPIAGILGDQQASLFAHGGWRKGIVKNTYGTGLFLMTGTGNKLYKSKKLLNTIGWKINNKITYALEGSVFIGGAVIQWLRDGLQILKKASESEKMALTYKENEGVYFVPALAGLGAPYWDPSARGIIIGITRGTTREHIVRAALESIAYQTRDVVEEMKKVVSDINFTKLGVDGGASQNNFLMQFQADILNMEIERPYIIETTGFGAAGIAGVTTSFWTKEEFLNSRKIEKVFIPEMEENKRDYYYKKWKDAVSRAIKWE